MEIIVVVVFIIMMIAGQRGKGRKSTTNIGKQVAQNVVPKTNNDYNTVLQSNNQEKSVKAFGEAGQTANKRPTRDEMVKPAFTGYNEQVEKKKVSKFTEKQLDVKKDMKDTTIEYVNVNKKENTTVTENTSSYGWGIFDDFAASDALYLARKDVERRKVGKAM